MTLSELSSRHCAKQKPALSIKGFVPDAYGVSHPQFRKIANGTRTASDQFLQRLGATHARLLPGEPADVPLPDNRVVHIDDDGISITFAAARK